MAKIHPQLEQLLQTNEAKPMSVLLVMKGDSEVSSLGLQSYKTLTPNVISAILSPQEIRELSKKPEILAIEEDSEVEIL